MMKCVKCGKTYPNVKKKCDICNIYLVNEKYLNNLECQNSNTNITINSEKPFKTNDNGSIGWFFLSIIFPIVGLILWLTWADTKPENSFQCKLGFVWSISISIIFTIIGFAIFAAYFF